jgi:hypothetical protein
MVKRYYLLMIVAAAAIVSGNSSVSAGSGVQVGADPITFDQHDLKVDRSSTNPRIWSTTDGDMLFLYRKDSRPEISAALTDIKGVRDYFRRVIEQAGGAILSVDVVLVDSVRTVRVISKTPQQPHGITFEGSYVFAFQNKWYALRIKCEEKGTTGLREAIIGDKAYGSGQVTISKGKGIMGWSKDPYDPQLQDGFRANLADQEKYDSLFPNHPLSRLRQIMRELDKSLHVSEELRAESAYTYPK